MSETHTPTPWFYDPKYESSALIQKVQDEDAEYWDDMCVECHSAKHGKLQDISNAEFIVRACNSHDALLKSCKHLVEQFLTYQNGWMGQGVWRNRIGLEQDLADTEEAIKLAEEGQ